MLHEIKVKGDIVQSLRHIQVGKRLPTDSNTGIFTKYCPCVLKASHQWSGLVLLTCRDEIIKCSNQLITPGLELMEPSPRGEWSEWHQMALHIEDAEVNKSTLNSIFKSFNKVFNESIISTSFLVAVVATYLRDYWYSTLPNNIKRNAIVVCISQYPELFSAGEIIIDLLSDDDIKITIDKELAFMYWFDKVDCKLK